MLAARTVKGERRLYYPKRILGAGRPTLDQSDIVAYEKALRRKKWTMQDVFVIANIRKFSPNSCVCSAWLQYVMCYHVRAARIKYESVVPAPNERHRRTSSLRGQRTKPEGRFHL